MDLRQLVDVEFRYHSMALAGPSNRAGRMFGAGEATFSGERLAGTATWANFPRVLLDGSTRPEAAGALTFQLDDESYAWLNDVVAIGEGSVDNGVLRMRYFECVGSGDPGF